MPNLFGISTGAKIHLEKIIPSPGGLGGGSSNAAMALFGLAKLWNLKIEFAVTQFKLAVPFVVVNHSFVIELGSTDSEAVISIGRGKQETVILQESAH